MGFHHEIGPIDAHAIHSWVYDNITDRDAHNPSEGSTDPITAADVALRRVCYVKTPAGFYFLTGISPTTWVQLGSAALAAHASQHESGGGDEVNVQNLPGELAADQKPKSHDLDAKHTGTIGEARTVFDDTTGHDHSGGSNKGTKVAFADLAGIPAAYPPIAHGSDHEDGGGDEIDVGGLSGELADPQPVKPHPLDPTGGDHTGTLAETSVLFGDSGHDHTGGTEGNKVPFSQLDGLPSNFSRGELLSYTDTTNKVIGPLASPPVINELSLWPIGGIAQEYGVDFTVRQVTGGSAPGYYICISTTSSAPGGGTFLGGSNPSVGIDTILSSGDKAQAVYPTYPAP